MTDITLTRLDIRTGNTTSWLYLRATTAGPYEVSGHLWALLPLDEEYNYCAPQTVFDPDSSGADHMGGAGVTGSLLLGCGCSRQLNSIATQVTADHAEIGINTQCADPESTAECCPEHRDIGGPWSANPDPLLDLTALITFDELASIRGSIAARREGIHPMSLAGLYGAAGVSAAEKAFAEGADQVETLRVMAALRGGVMEQSDPAWFRVR